KMTKWGRGLLASLALLVAFFVGFVAFTWIRLQPWLAPPEASPSDIEKRWVAVVNLQPPPRPREGDELLLEAISLQAKTKKRDCCKSLTEIPPDALVPSERSVVAKLVEWHESDGVVVPPLCVVTPEGELETARDRMAVASLRLAGLAVGSALGEEDMSQVLAAWHLGDVLRRHGRVLGVAVGYAIRARTIEWFASGGVELPEGLDVSTPSPAELYGALARDAV